MDCIDILGREFKVGNIIAYPGRSGSSLWLSIGMITEIGSEQVKRYWEENYRTEYWIKVIGFSNGRWHRRKSKWEMKSRIALVDYKRCIILYCWPNVLEDVIVEARVKYNVQ